MCHLGEKDSTERTLWKTAKQEHGLQEDRIVDFFPE